VGGLSSDTAEARVNLSSGTNLTINQGFDSIYSGQIQGSGGITKSGTGTLRLENTSTYSGGTTITAGKVEFAATGALGNGTVTLNGTSSQLNTGSVNISNAIAFGTSGGILSGTGTFTSNVAIGTNSTIAPGNSVGTLSFTNGLTWGSGGSYQFEMQGTSGGPGVGWDFLQVTNPLTFTATVGAPFTLNLLSLTSGGTPGNVSNFISSTTYSWSILSASSIVGFDANAVTINTSGFTSSLNGGAFTLGTSGTNLVLTFTPVPEPSTWALLIAGLGVVVITTLRRRRRGSE
jgi:autotransporter-associated beta strand protein